MQMVSFTVIQVLEISSLRKYLTDGYHKHVHTYSTCIMKVKIVYIPHFNESLMHRWYD